ncbi:MAG: hypothetical protein WCF03_03405 [Nitrososphaeraceae archaeon]
MDHVTGQRNDKVLVIVDNVHDKGISSIFYVMDTTTAPSSYLKI